MPESMYFKKISPPPSLEKNSYAYSFLIKIMPASWRFQEMRSNPKRLNSPVYSHFCPTYYFRPIASLSFQKLSMATFCPPIKWSWVWFKDTKIHCRFGPSCLLNIHLECRRKDRPARTPFAHAATLNVTWSGRELLGIQRRYKNSPLHTIINNWQQCRNVLRHKAFSFNYCQCRRSAIPI